MQHFKTVYFADLAGGKGSRKSLTLAFGESELQTYREIEHMSSVRLRAMLGHDSFHDLEKQAHASGKTLNNHSVEVIASRISSGLLESSEKFTDQLQATFSGGRHDPMHDWFPYLEGYSPDFVWGVLRSYAPNAKAILDPFGGSGTTPITAMMLGKHGYYSDVNPLCRRIIEAKVVACKLSSESRLDLGDGLNNLITEVRSSIQRCRPDKKLRSSYVSSFGKSVFFSDENYLSILKTRSMLDGISDPEIRRFAEIAAIRSLIPASNLIRRGDLRFKNEKELSKGTPSFIDEFVSSLELVASDISALKLHDGFAECVGTNAQTTEYIHRFDAVVTSPPYLNGTNYFRNTKIELWFTRELFNKNGLRAFRDQAITSGINDVTKGKSKKLGSKYKNDGLAKVVEAVTKSAYDMRIPLMVQGYFDDLHATFESIVPKLNKGGIVAVDIGDSSYAGVHVPTDSLLADMLETIGLELVEEVVLRERMSRSGFRLSQKLLIFKKNNKKSSQTRMPTKWRSFKRDMPHQYGDMAARNWGNKLHSLCSYQGKLKPAIANLLVDALVPKGGKVLDPFSGVGTIPFEAALNGKQSFGLDISPSAFFISDAKLRVQSPGDVESLLGELESYVEGYEVAPEEVEAARLVSFNSSIVDYFHPETLKEVLAARSFFAVYRDSPEFSLLQACMQHILHGNRPYALSRRSHPITPYAPTGEFEYRSLIERLRAKADRSLSQDLGSNFVEGKVWNLDCTAVWPEEISDLDAIITSPPFFDSTRFYLANWMRLWFSGWERESFNTQPKEFIDERQKEDFFVYDAILKIGAQRLKNGGYFALHLGESKKCDMNKEITEIAKRYFTVADKFVENVEHCESHGFRDKGTVTGHQYLVLQK